MIVIVPNYFKNDLKNITVNCCRVPPACNSTRSVLSVFSSPTMSTSPALPYGAWEKASKSISTLSLSDEKYPELYEQLQDHSEPHNYFFAPYSTWSPQLFFQEGTFHPYPSILSNAYKQLKRSNFHGLLSSIHHAWFSIDNKLFLWDYTKKQQIVQYDAFEQEISTVAVLAPKNNIFREFVHHVLVVATSVEIVLIGIVMEAEGSLKLHSSPLKISTDNEPISSIVGLNGRIFFGGEQGLLHEFVYDTDATVWQSLGWTKSCRKITHGTSYYSKTLKPIIASLPLPFLSTESPIVQIVVDTERNMVCTLNSASVIAVYDCGVSGTEMSFVAEMNVLQAGLKFCKTTTNTPNVQVFDKLPRGHAITSLSVLPRNESTFIHLLAVSSAGFRYYITTFDKNKYSTGRAIPVATRSTCCSVVHLRLPPPRLEAPSTSVYEDSGIQPLFVPSASAENVQKSYYKQGVLLMLDALPGKHGRVVGIAQDLINRKAGAVSASQKPIFRESVSSESVHGAVHDVVEFENPDSTSAYGTSKDDERSNNRLVLPSKRSTDTSIPETQMVLDKPIVLSELVTQFCLPQRNFLCLTHMGLQVIKKLRPIDYLVDLLVRQCQTQDMQPLSLFFKQYGSTSVCAMLFGIACGLAVDRNLDVRQNEMLRCEAIRSAIEFGGTARVADSMATPSSGRFVMTDDMLMSDHHDGLVMLVSRLLRPVWNFPFAGASLETGKDATRKELRGHCRHSKAILQGLRESLFQLKVVMENTMPYSVWITAPVSDGNLDEVMDGMHPSRRNVMTRALNYNAQQDTANVDTNRQARAMKAEQESIHCLFALITRAMQAISLLLVATTYPAVFEEKALIRLSFGDWISLKSNEIASRTMVTSMMNIVLKESGRVDVLVDTLRRECSSFFSVGDVWTYQGCQLLVKAKSTLDASKRETMLLETLTQFLRASKHWKGKESMELLKKTCRDFTALSFFNGVVDLALACALNFDVFVWDGNMQNSSSTSSVLNPIRMECYQCIFDSMKVLLNFTDTSSSISNGVMQDGGLSLSVDQREKISKAVLNRAVTSKDEHFHEALYTWLLESNRSDLLVDIASDYIEAFLRSLNDDLLSNYYVRQGRYGDAALTMWFKAVHEDPQLENNPTIQERLGYFTRALSYAESSTACSMRTDMATSLSPDKIAEMREKLDIAALQADILSALQADLQAVHGDYDMDTLQEQQEDLQALQYRYLDVSALYNRFATKYELWEQCLAIMQSCFSNDSDAITKHWMRIIYSKVPSDSDNISASNWLRKQAESCGASMSSVGKFEDGQWATILEHKIHTLGRKFCNNTGADYIFSVNVIARILEELWNEYTLLSSETSLSKAHWIVKMFKSVNISYRVLYESYMSMYHEKGVPVWQLQMVQSMCFIAEQWHEDAISFQINDVGNARVSFAEYCPNLVRTFEELSTDLQALHVPSELESSKGMCLDDLLRLKQMFLSFREQHFS